MCLQRNGADVQADGLGYTCAPSFCVIIIFFIDEVDLIFSKAHLWCTNQASRHRGEANDSPLMSKCELYNNKWVVCG